MTALLMAGGRATRMGGEVEKPLLQISGKSILERMVETLRSAASIERIVVASSPNTPATCNEAKRLGVDNVLTPGDGFEEDMRFAIRQLSLGEVLVLSCDLPLVTADIIERTVREYRVSGKPALAVMAPVQVYENLGSSYGYVFKIHGQNLVPVGINIIDGGRINEGELDQDELIINSEDIALNVNTLKDLETARKKLESRERMNDEKPMSRKVPRTLLVARIAAFSALSVVGSFIHLPSPVPTVAFDSTPGFFVALLFGPLEGSCVLGLGHLATAIVNGFPLGILHLPIAVGLAAAGAVVGEVNRRWNYIPAILSGIAINTGLVVVAIPVLGVAATLSFTPYLLLAAAVNGVVATVAYLVLRRRL